MNGRKWTMSTTLKILLCVFWLFAIVLPLIRMLSTMASVDVGAVITAKKFSKALRQSLLVSFTATVISVSLAGLLSWAVARTNIHHNTYHHTDVDPLHFSWHGSYYPTGSEWLAIKSVRPYKRHLWLFGDRYRVGHVLFSSCIPDVVRCVEV